MSVKHLNIASGNINTNLLWFYVHDSFEAWLRAFDVKLQLHMLQAMLDVFHMPKVEIYIEHMHKTLNFFIKNQ